MAHCGIEKTYQSIKQNYWFPTMRKHIHDYIQNCLTCVFANCAPNRFEGETHLYPLPKMPLDLIHIDHFGPLQETSENFKYILVCIDVLSRFTWLFPTKSTGSKEVIDCIEKIKNTFGKPLEIVSDRDARVHI